MFDLRRTATLGLSLFGLLLTFDHAHAFLAYVSNEKGNSISVVDTDKMETVATIPTGQRPRGIEVSRDGKLSSLRLATTTRSKSSIPRLATTPAICRPVRILNNSRSIPRERCSTSPTKMMRW